MDGQHADKGDVRDHVDGHDHDFDRALEDENALFRFLQHDDDDFPGANQPRFQIQETVPYTYRACNSCY